jgi:hypothetical protein
MNDLFFDFHTHTLSPDYILPEAIGAITIPMGAPPGYDWKSLMTISGMTAKPAEYTDWLRAELPGVNARWYAETQRVNQILIEQKDDNVPFFYFVPWISLRTNIDAVRDEEWFQNSPIVKFIPVLDDIPWMMYNETTHTSELEPGRDSFAIEMHHIIAQLPQPAIMIHTGWGSAPAEYHNLIGNFPEKTFILAHLKEDDDSDNFERQSILNEFDNCFVEMSYLSSPKRITQYIKLGYEDRILFGSDYRTVDDAPTLRWMLDAVKLAPISDEARRKIRYENARMLLERLGIIS